MDKKTWPIGTIVKVREQLAMVTGYSFSNYEGHMANHYILLPFPTGYMDPDSFITVYPDEIELVSKGYETKASNYITNYIDKVNHIADSLSYEEMTQYMEQANI